MRRRVILVGVLAMALAGCGGSSATPSPSASESVSAAPSSDAGSASPGTSQGSSSEASASAAPAADISTAICDSVSLRKQPSSSGARVKTINSGTAVHVVATVDGTAYTAGSCGVSGSQWLKIDQVGGKAAKTLYGVQYVYAAAGFFQ